ncbi:MULTISPECIES: GNAT family N-acetyltransferase [Streptomyces]|uniref:Acetyltransferase n=1 Tax=Streptomyces griseus subsp. griseus (strain JCM 4626 / CBS 651.72 / NBRC 13350 / KCC S-0626 / ISP 5235) TaxID=455632 RepID=B1W1N6_STRGG|nr:MULTISPECIES: GNAT family N-acetyltransferase [Streptomyces]MYR50082.1 GNAT family N-acetyltransferase [Streptomyces sp. SID4928]EGE42033.1 GCN5-related N-acetyltransferase [Streptomyces sp. ACT-1]MBW3704912.1 GNAT family N-acetyltransferase [Streptomyces griseus]SEE91971.1 mycothiol synthase [Streptomyces griseus]SQA23928.1 acetyltransferase [Streptomyces griseus]
MSVNSGNGLASLKQLPGYVLRPYHGHEDDGAMAAVRLGCAERDRVDARSVVEGLPTAAEIAEASAKLDDPSENQALVEHSGGVVGYATIRRWQERDGTWLYLHRGYLMPEHRGQGIGSAMLNWAESRIRQLVQQHGTARTAVLGANAMVSEQDATALLLDAGYRRVFSLVELELADLRQLPDRKPLPDGVRVGAVDPSSYRAAWKTVVDSYAEAAFTERWTFESFLASAADPTCWRAAWDREALAGVALCSIRRRNATVGEIEELSVRKESRRLGLGRALLLDGLRCLREHGAETARLYTGTANPHRSYDLYEDVGFRRQNEHVRYRKPI